MITLTKLKIEKYKKNAPDVQKIIIQSIESYSTEDKPYVSCRKIKTYFEKYASPEITERSFFLYMFDDRQYENNLLTDVAFRILSILCSEAPVERIFGGLSYMFDDKSNRMKDDLLDAKLRIRIQAIYEHLFEFEGSMLKRLEKCDKYFNIYSFKNLDEVWI